MTRVLAAVVLVCSMGIAGCGGGDSPTRADSPSTSDSSTSTSDSSTSTSDSSTSTSDSSTSTSDSSTSSTPAASSSSADSECIGGTWELLADQVAGLFRQGPMANLPGFTATASGSGFVEFKADGTYHYTPDYSIEISLNGMTGTGQWSGTLDGTWSLADTNFVMGQTSNNLTGSVSLGGSELPMPTNRTFSGTAAIVSCQPETLTYEMNSPLGLLRTTLLRVS